MPKQKPSPHERVYSLKHENKALKQKVAGLAQEIKLMKAEYREDMRQFKAKIRAVVTRAVEKRAAQRPN